MKLKEDVEFQLHWKMEILTTMAKQKLGALEIGQKYCLKMPAFLSGTFTESNLGTISQSEQIDFSDYLAKQIEDLPDGAEFEIQLK